MSFDLAWYKSDLVHAGRNLRGERLVNHSVVIGRLRVQIILWVASENATELLVLLGWLRGVVTRHSEVIVIDQQGRLVVAQVSASCWANSIHSSC